MKYTHYIYKLENGLKIITPNGKEITKEEYDEHSSSVLCWLEIANPTAFKFLRPNNVIKDVESLFRIFDEIVVRRKFPRDLLNLNGITFIYVIGYFIQNSREPIEPLLAHLMARALMKWLPNSQLIEEYLLMSADSGNIEDACTLLVQYSEERTFYKIKKNVSGALKYGEFVYNNFLDDRRNVRYKGLYAKALFESDPKGNVNKAVDIMLDIVLKERNLALDTLIDLLEILSKEKVDREIDFKELESIIYSEEHWNQGRYKAQYWLAKCYISGVNRRKNVKVAIRYLKDIINHDVDMMAEAGASLAELYYNGDGVYVDYDEAFFIASSVQDAYLELANTSDSKLDEICYNCSIKSIKAMEKENDLSGDSK